MKKEEHEIQKAAVMALKIFILPRYDNPPLYAVPNGGHRHPKVAREMKEEGVTAGIPDLCLLRPMGEYPLLFIETKTPKGTFTESQKKMFPTILSEGYPIAVCRSAQDIIDTVVDYLEGRYVQQKIKFGKRKK